MIGKKMKTHHQKPAILLLLSGLILAGIMMALPLYTFRAVVYTKKSANTFVGDEKYQEVLAEVEAAAKEFRDQGMDVKRSESVTERTNSKGETTSLVAFTLEESFHKNLWSLIGSALPSAWVLRLITACSLLAVICGVIGCAGSHIDGASSSPDELRLPDESGKTDSVFGSAAAGETESSSEDIESTYRTSLWEEAEARYLPKKSRLFRGAAMVFLMLDMLCVPVLILLNNYTFWRRLRLYRNDLLSEGKDQFYAALDGFLFGGNMGEKIEAAVNNLDMSHSPLVWLLLACFFISFAGAVLLRHGRVKKSLLKTFLYVFIIAVCVVTIYPYYVMFITGFRSNAETLDMYFLHLVPTKWLWSNLTDIISRGVPRYLMNSLIVAGGATALAMLCGIPAAYAMARMDFKGKKLFLGFVIMSQMFSPVVLLIGISQLMNTIRLNDTLLGLIFVNAAFNQAFAVWLLRGTFIAISPEMEQAAKIDGCSTVSSLIRILLPMAAPGIVTTLIFVFINAWNEYTISTVLISTASNRPITVGITQFSSFNMIEWQYLIAASLLATIPVVILFMAIEKHLTSGLTSGGVKG